MFDVTIVGDATLDTFLMIKDAIVTKSTKKNHSKLCFTYADKIPIMHTTQSIGGNAANIAMGTKKLGLKTAIITELGDDINGITIEHELRRAGIDTRYTKILKGKQTRYSVVLNFDSERTVLSHYVDRNYSFPNLEKTEWIYYTSLGKSFEKIQSKILTYLKKNPETKLAFNPGSYQKKYGLSALKKLLPHVNLLFVNKEEAELFVGKKLPEKKLIEQLHTYGVTTVVLTDGEQGSWASEGNGVYYMPKYAVKVLAKAGAGDAYASAFLSAIAGSKTLSQAMQWGTANASAVVQAYGAQGGILGKAGIEKVIKTHAKVLPKKL